MVYKKKLKDLLLPCSKLFIRMGDTGTTINPHWVVEIYDSDNAKHKGQSGYHVIPEHKSVRELTKKQKKHLKARPAEMKHGVCPVLRLQGKCALSTHPRGSRCQWTFHPAHYLKRNQLCHFFAASTCNKGSNCDFSHDYKKKPCKFFYEPHLKCSRGEDCQNSHTVGAQVFADLKALESERYEQRCNKRKQYEREKLRKVDPRLKQGNVERKKKTQSRSIFDSGGSSANTGNIFGTSDATVKTNAASPDKSISDDEMDKELDSLTTPSPEPQRNDSAKQGFDFFGEDMFGDDDSDCIGDSESEGE